LTPENCVGMKYEYYSDYRYTYDYSVFDFISIGKKGPIPKRITFTNTELAYVYNLAFGDVDENGDLDDFRISDNGDRNKILATVFYIVEAYTRKFPERWIYFKGSTVERTRLYRIAVGLNFEELSQKFEIFALVNEELKPFCKNMAISAFVIKRKKY
jgi:hypothetical protein